MDKNITVNLDFGGNAIENAVIHPLASAPSSPTIGQIYYDTTLNSAMVWNGSAWRNADAATLTDGSIQNAALAPIPSSFIPDLTGTIQGTSLTSAQITDLTGTILSTSLTSAQITDLTGTIQATPLTSAQITDLTGTIQSTSLTSGQITDFTTAVEGLAPAGIANGTSVQTGANFNIDGSGTVGAGFNVTGELYCTGRLDGHNIQIGSGSTSDGYAAFGAQGSSFVAKAFNAGSVVFSDGTAATQDTVGNEFVARASGGFTFYTDATGTPAATLSGGNLAVVGTISAANLVAGATLQAVGGTNSTSSTTAVMSGQGTDGWNFTPAAGRPILVNVSGTLGATGTGNGVEIQLSYGTGTPPNHNDAATGTAIGGAISMQLPGVADASVPFALNAVISGLTAGTPYWFDIQYQTSSDSVELDQPNITVVEL